MGAAAVPLLVAATVATNYIGSKRQERKARKRARAMDQLALERQAAIDADIAQVNEAFGVGDGGVANENQSRLSSYLNEFEQSLLQSGQDQALDEFGNALRNRRFSLARAGLTGSGPDSATRRRTMADLIRRKQGAVSSALSGRSQLAQRFENQRQNLVSQIASGRGAGLADPYRAQMGVLSDARSNIGANALDSLFTTSGDVVRTNAAASGGGRQGLSGLFDERETGSIY